jgi:SAM-dependent methyltransferase
MSHSGLTYLGVGSRTKGRESQDRQNWMHPIRWIPADANSLLDVGCNVGELLRYCSAVHPAMRLFGVEVNSFALLQARKELPEAVFYEASAAELPFPDEVFDCVTCIEVLEHIPARLRQAALTEMGRVLRRGGRLVLRVPHAGLFAFLDSNNLRFRMPRLYGALLKKGRRDSGYAEGSEEVVWHHHFTRKELEGLLGKGWELESFRTGGLFLMAVADLASWPFYRLRRTNNISYRLLQRIANFDIGCDYGRASFDILMVLRRT